jgi:type II secretory pathway pseudopilin PulG
MRINLLKSERGFTMVEIAICLAVIAFGIVAIIGVLPSGLQAQRDNREDTIVNQDGAYLLAAIKSGSKTNDLADYVQSLTLLEIVPPGSTNEVPRTINPATLTSRRIMGLLSTPVGAGLRRVEARVRSLSGPAIEKGPGNETIALDYQLWVQVSPVTSVDPLAAFGGGNTNDLAELGNRLQQTLYEIRLIFRWPVLPDGRVGGNRRVFRTLFSGVLSKETDPDVDLYFFEPSAHFARQP